MEPRHGPQLTAWGTEEAPANNLVSMPENASVRPSPSSFMITAPTAPVLFAFSVRKGQVPRRRAARSISSTPAQRELGSGLVALAVTHVLFANRL
jgi:hypothetical protein